MAKTEKGHGNGVNESKTTDTFGIIYCESVIQRCYTYTVAKPIFFNGRHVAGVWGRSPQRWMIFQQK